MIKNIYRFKLSDKSKIVLLVGIYIVFSEIIKYWAVIYVLEQSLELKLILFWFTIMLIYKIQIQLLYLAIIFFLFLSLNGVPIGFIVYIIVFYVFVKLLNQIRKPANE